MKRVTSLLLILLAVVSTFASLHTDDSRAQEILKKAREAAGGEAELQKVQSLYLSGQYRRQLGDRQMGGDREISIQFPNKFLVEDSMSMGGMSTAITTSRGLNGEQAWTANSGGGGGMVFRFNAGGQQLTPEQMEEAFRRQFRVEFARYALGMLLSPPESFQLNYKYAGESDVDDAKADVLDVTGPENFAARVYFDKESHLPLLVSYRGRKPRMVTMTRPAGGAPTSTDIKKLTEEAQKKAEAESQQIPEEVDFFIRLSDHKKVNGVTLPYKFTFLTESEVSEEFEVKKYQVNPQFKADKFAKR